MLVLDDTGTGAAGDQDSVANVYSYLMTLVLIWLVNRALVLAYTLVLYDTGTCTCGRQWVQ